MGVKFLKTRYFDVFQVLAKNFASDVGHAKHRQRLFKNLTPQPVELNLFLRCGEHSESTVALRFRMTGLES